MRRLLLPGLLVLIALVTGVTAVVLDRADPAAAAAEDASTAVTPLLSARRLPEYVTTPGADLALRLRLIELVKAAPPGACLVVEAGDREILAHEADRALLPASNQKTVLGVALLEELGPDYRYSTQVRGGPVDGGGVLRGDAWLVGGGDPVLSTADYAASGRAQDAARTALEDLADAVADAGVTRITGRLVGDETRYDTARRVPTWRPGSGLTPGPLTALSVNDGFTDSPEGAEPGAPFGPAADPARRAAATLALLLSERGIAVDGGVATGRAGARAPVVAEIESAPLSEIVGQMLTYSDNQTSELLLKELGLQVRGTGSTEAGVDALAAVLTGLGVDLAGSRFADGSGLSDANRHTCGLLVDLLVLAGSDSQLADGLAVAGESGTLAEAFLGTPAQGRVRAKTGSLNDTTTLAGFVTHGRADDLAFALLVNRDPFIEAADAELRDAVVLVMADYPQRPRLRRVGPVPVEG